MTLLPLFIEPEFDPAPGLVGALLIVPLFVEALDDAVFGDEIFDPLLDDPVFHPAAPATPATPATPAAAPFDPPLPIEDPKLDEAPLKPMLPAETPPFDP